MTLHMRRNLQNILYIENAKIENIKIENTIICHR